MILLFLLFSLIISKKSEIKKKLRGRLALQKRDPLTVISLSGCLILLNNGIK